MIRLSGARCLATCLVVFAFGCTTEPTHPWGGGDGGGDGGSSSGIVPGPTALRAEAGSLPGEIRLEWRTLPEAATYNLYWSTSPGVTPATGTKVINVSPPYFYGGLPPGDTAYHVVTAVSETGVESQPSAEAAATTSGAVQLRVLLPNLGLTKDSLLPVVIRAASVSQFAEVTATLGGTSSAMSYLSHEDVWIDTLSLSGLAGGDQRLTFRATNVQGEAALSTVNLRYDRPPVLTLIAPKVATIQGSSVRVAATCQDDVYASCAALRVTIGTELVASGTASVDQTVDLRPFDGRRWEMRVTAVDSVGQVTEVIQAFSVQASSHLTRVSPDDGRQLLDATADRLLLLDTVNLKTSVLDRGSGAEVVILSGVIAPGLLVRDGAIFFGEQNWYEWLNGTLSTLASRPSEFRFARGTTLVWPHQARPGDVYVYFLVHKDLTSGTETVISDTSAGLSTPDIGPNDDVVWSSYLGGVFRYRAGVRDQLAPFGSSNPLTDGNLVVYARSVPDCCEQIVLLTAGGEVTLTDDHGDVPVAHANYDVNNGWVAFTRPPPGGGPVQVWLRSPAGQVSQVSQFGQPAKIEAVGPQGDVVFITDATGSPRRYWARHGQTPADISSGLGTAKFLGNDPYVLLETILFRVE